MLKLKKMMGAGSVITVLLAAPITIISQPTPALSQLQPVVVGDAGPAYVPGQAWRWIIFGDAEGKYDGTGRFGGESNLTNWVGDLSKSSPWIKGFSRSGGVIMALLLVL